MTFAGVSHLTTAREEFQAQVPDWFPGNIAQYAERTYAFGLDSDAKRLGRLFGQPALVAAALWAGGIPHRGS